MVKKRNNNETRIFGCLNVGKAPPLKTTPIRSSPSRSHVRFRWRQKKTTFSSPPRERNVKVEMFSKKEYQRRCQEEQEANGRVFQDFLETFQTDVNNVRTKTWVKAGSFDACTGREDDTEKGALYEPKPLLKGHQDPQTALRSAIECARIIKDKKSERASAAARKPTTNLEALKEEIKQRHIERQRVKEAPAPAANGGTSQAAATQDILDPNSTNLYIGNISPKLTENDLVQMFGAYGPLASVKIMWPRGEDNVNRNSHCGFVAYMSRKDAERAYEDMKTTDIKASWGKFVEVPQVPIYVPPALQSLTQPPPFSGLPFNAQPTKPHDKDLYSCTVKVSVPADKKLLCVIHRVVEFVIREGPLFEAMIMNRELKNPLFKFLFENTNPAHTYYRWKLYSVMNGEAVKTWSTKPFRMFSGGSVWIPPTSLDYSKGMPEHLLDSKRKCSKMPRLSETQCKRFVRFLRELNPKRLKIGETMVFCLNHADCYAEIVEYIAESSGDPATNPLKKLARLFLVSDILCNCNCRTVKNQNFRAEFERHLPEIFAQLRQTLQRLTFSCDREAFKTRVLKVLREWELWKIYPDNFLRKLETSVFRDGGANSDSEISDTPLEDEDDLNIPLPEESAAAEATAPANPGFIPSRWETVDPEEVEAQAMSTKKFYRMEMQRKEEEKRGEEPSASTSTVSGGSASQKLNDKKRKRLREVEVMVMQYQDELEAGRKKLRKDTTLEKEVERCRAKLMEKMLAEKNDSSNSSSSDDKENEERGASRGRRSKRIRNERRSRRKY